MPRRYRVITSDFKGGFSVMTDWLTWNRCRRFILARWGHWPPFAHISRTSGADRLQKQFGLE